MSPTILAHLRGIKAVIVFPALGTPCLVKVDNALQVDGPMHVVVAVHKDHVDGNEKKKIEKFVPFVKDKPLDAYVAAKFHSHLALHPWGANTFEKLRNKNHYCSHIKDLRRKCFLIYRNYSEALNKVNMKKYKVYAIEKLRNGKDLMIYNFDKENKKVPFGVLHKSAVHMYISTGYIYLYYLRFDEFEVDAAELKELAWLYYDHDELLAHGPSIPENELNMLLYKPDDELVCTAMEQGFSDPPQGAPNAGSPKAVPPINKEGGFGELLDKNVGTQPITIKRDGQDLIINQYRLQTPGSIGQKENGQTTGQSPLTPQGSKLPFCSQEGGALLHLRHPVYFSGKEYLNIGMIADAHISSRQTVYGRVGAQVIPGADKSRSALIGPTAHVNLSSTVDLLTTIGGSNECDIMTVIGDIYDHTMNLNVKKCIEDIKTTGQLWEYMNYAHNFGAYIPRIDGMMFISLLLNFYNEKKKPVFFVTGNHEAYWAALGISPRLTGEFMMLNAGIPADLNLTPYEAILLYGKHFHRFYIVKSFQEKNLNWIHAVLTPWKDCLVSYGSSQSHALLGWGNDETKIKPTGLGGGSLPRATEALTGDQLALLNYVVKYVHVQRKIMISHFPLINFEENIPFKEHKWESGKDLPKEPLEMQSSVIFRTSYSPHTLGTVTNYQIELLNLLIEKRIHLALSGHAHRAAAYRIEPLAIQDGVPYGHCVPSGTRGDEGLEGAALDLQRNSYGIVCGSTGPFSKQNIYGEFDGWGIEKPQGMSVNVETGELRIIRHSGSKPRLAVVAEYMYINNVHLMRGGVRCRPDDQSKCCLAEFLPDNKYFDYLGPNFIEKMTLAAVDFDKPGNPVIRVVEFKTFASQASRIEKLKVEKKQEKSVEHNKAENDNPLENRKIILSSSDSYDTILKNIDKSSDSIKFFISVDFEDNRNLQSHYVLSGYCFPVKIDAVSPAGFNIYRGWAEYFTEGDTLPDFKIYMRLQEYK